MSGAYGAPVARVALGFVLAASVLGQGGASPAVLLALHGALVLALLWERCAPGQPRAGLPASVSWGYLAFLACAAISAGRAPYAYGAVLGFVELVFFFAAAYLAGRAGAGSLGAWVPWLLAAAGAQGVVATVQRWAFGELRPAGTFLNPNHMAAWIVAVLLLAFGIQRGRWPAWAATAGACGALGILWSASRGALLGLVAGVATMVVLERRRSGRELRWGIAVALVLVLAVAGVALRWGMPDPYRYTRVRFWAAVGHSIATHPWLGIGPRQWPAEAPRWNPPIENGPLRWERLLRATHSDYLRLPAELGLVGCAAALLALALWWRALRSQDHDRRQAGLTGALAALAALAAHASVDNLSERPAIYLLAAALLGASVARPAGKRPSPRVPARLAWGAGLLAALVLLDVAPYRAWAALARARTDPDRRLLHLERSRRANPYHYEPWLQGAELRAREGWTLDDYVLAREWSEHAVRLQPADAWVRLRRARIERRAFFEFFLDVASRERVRRLYEEAIERAPKEPLFHVELGRFLLAAADPAGARREAERALSLEPNLVPARLLLAETLLVSGAPDAASRARGLLAEAREISERWRHRAAESAYARRALTLDTAWVARIEARLAEAS